jgi:hypothetical protein
MAEQLQLPAVVEPIPLPEYVRGKLEGLEFRLKARNERRARLNAARRKRLDLRAYAVGGKAEAE